MRRASLLPPCPRLMCASRARAANTELSSKVEAADARVEGAKRAREHEFLQLQLKVAKLEGQQGMHEDSAFADEEESRNASRRASRSSCAERAAPRQSAPL